MKRLLPPILLVISCATMIFANSVVPIGYTLPAPWSYVGNSDCRSWHLDFVFSRTNVQSRKNQHHDIRHARQARHNRPLRLE